LEQQFDAVVIGAGATGLAAADKLKAAGHSVLVLEAAPKVGGLARSISVGGEPIEAYYHHIFPQDHEVRELAERLGMSADLEWRHGSMAILHRGRPYRFDSPLDLLRFSPLSFLSRIRSGLATAFCVIRPDNGRLDRHSVVAESRRAFGGEAFELLWQTLLEAKFGSQLYKQLPMAWLVARLRQRAGARKAGGDKLGYLRGSLGRLLEAYAAQLAQAGVPIWTAAPVTSLTQEDGGWSIFCEHEGAWQKIHARVVIAALSGGLLLKLAPQVPAAYGDQLRAIPYRGVVCALVELDRPVSLFYWTNLTQGGASSCVGIIEHTNLIPAERYGGRHLIYLAHYVDPADPIFEASPEAILSAAEPALRALNLEYSRTWVTNITVSRDRYAQPVPQIGGPMPTLPIETGLAGLLHGSLAHIYPHDRGVAMSLRLGARLAQTAEGSLAAHPAPKGPDVRIESDEISAQAHWEEDGGAILDSEQTILPEME